MEQVLDQESKSVSATKVATRASLGSRLLLTGLFTWLFLDITSAGGAAHWISNVGFEEDFWRGLLWLARQYLPVLYVMGMALFYSLRLGRAARAFPLVLLIVHSIATVASIFVLPWMVMSVGIWLDPVPTNIGGHMPFGLHWQTYLLLGRVFAAATILIQASWWVVAVRMLRAPAKEQ